jgi:4-hydroxybenzoate polyprenyltransferase
MDEANAEVRTPSDQAKSPSSIKTLLTICRVSNLPTVWMNVVAAAALSGATPDIGTVALLALSLSAFYCTGMALNDIFDREWDAEHQPFRPIPTGQLSLRRAWLLATILVAVGFTCLLAAPHPSAMGPGVVLLALIFAYDRFHKRFAGSIIIMASTRTMVFVVTSWALIEGVTPLVLVGGGAQFLYTFLVTAVARHEHTRGEPYGFPRA